MELGASERIPINPRWMVLIIAIPIATALWLHMPMLVEHGQGILKVLSILPEPKTPN